jgi:hypothetical protein
MVLPFDIFNSPLPVNDTHCASCSIFDWSTLIIVIGEMQMSERTFCFGGKVPSPHCSFRRWACSFVSLTRVLLLGAPILQGTAQRAHYAQEKTLVALPKNPCGSTFTAFSGGSVSRGPVHCAYSPIAQRPRLASRQPCQHPLPQRVPYSRVPRPR